jgi:hypothetical protein
VSPFTTTSIHIGVRNANELRALDPTKFPSFVTVTETNYLNNNDGGGGVYDWNPTSTLTDDSVLVYRPTAVASGSPGRFIRRLNGNVLTPEAAGMVGDYSFVTDTGTDNTANFNKAMNALAYNAGSGNQGGTLVLPAGKTYLLSSSVTIPAGVKISGPGYSAKLGTYTGIASILQMGGSLVIPSTASITENTSTSIEGVRILRKGLNPQPTDAQVAAAVATWAGETSVAVKQAQSDTELRDVMIIGFNLCIQSTATRTFVFNSRIDCVNGLDASGSGDTSVYRDVRAIPTYKPTDGTSVGITLTRPGIALNLHDRGDTTLVENFESVGWLKGIHLSNVWDVTLNTPLVEGYGTFINSAAGAGAGLTGYGIQTENVVSYARVNTPYIYGFARALDFQAVNSTRATIANPGGQTNSDFALLGGNLAPNYSGATTGIINVGGNSSITLANFAVNRQGSPVFILGASNNGVASFDAHDIRIDEYGSSTLAFSDIATIDPTVLATSHFRNIFGPYQNAFLFGPGGVTLDISKQASVPTAAPGVGHVQLFAVAGTNAGTCALKIIAGTSTTPVTIADNIGSGC